MRETYTSLLNEFLQSSGNAGSTDPVLTSFFTRHLSRKYQQAFSELGVYETQQTKTAVTAIGQQYYHYPMGFVNIETVTVTVGSIAYPIITLDSQLQWDYTNRLQFVVNSIPTFLFPRRDDFGIYPIPQAVYTITFNYHMRDRALGVADYNTGTVTTVANSQTVTGVGTAWTTAMINRWFVMNDPTKQAQGMWYRIIDVPNATTLTLETSYESVGVSGATYNIGESPELPEEIHLSLVDGVLADYYAGPRKDAAMATWFNNVFWTGDGNQNKREEQIFTGGILGAKQRYAGRSDGALVYRRESAGGLLDRSLLESIR